MCNTARFCEHCAFRARSDQREELGREHSRVLLVVFLAPPLGITEVRLPVGNATASAWTCRSAHSNPMEGSCT